MLLVFAVSAVNCTAVTVHAGATADGDRIGADAQTQPDQSDSANADKSTRPTNCTAWAQMVPSESVGGTGYAVIFRLGPNGEAEWLWYRDCDDGLHYEYRGGPTPAEVANDVYDEASAKLPKPVLSLTGRLDFQIVNEETAVSVAPIAPVAVTAEVPGLSVTVTATPKLVRLDTGSIVRGDTTRIECAPWGGDGCSWTPRDPSVLKTTGFDDHRYHATVPSCGPWPGRAVSGRAAHWPT